MEQIQPLANFPLIATDRVEQAQFKLSQELTDLKIIRVADRKNFHFQMNGAKIGCTSLVYNRLGTSIKIRSGQPGDSVIFVFGSGVPSTFILDNKPVVVSHNNAAIVKPSQQVQVDRPKNSEVFVLRASLSDLLHHFQILIDRHHRGTISFEHSANINNSSAGMAKALVNNLINELNTNDLVLNNPDLLERYEDMLLTALLYLPHKDREKLYEKGRNQVAPGIVRRAEEYMRAHLNQGITISDLLMICSCSRNVLFAAFRNARGYTPLEFLTEQRLQSARRKLLRPDWKKPVTSIALECGFIHLGRFSRLYRNRFGERPSDTLRKGR
jgi:AraC-like DNA-binding protein